MVTKEIINNLKSWQSYIIPFIKKYDRENKKIFTAFRAELKRKKITSITDENKLWRTKYKPRFDALQKKHDREYDILWKKYHKKL